MSDQSLKQSHHFAVVIPAFNEEQTIRQIVLDVLTHCMNVIVVDDGSLDDTVAQITDLPITILRNAMNRGKDASLLRGFKYAENFGVQAVITLDADGQHDCDDLPKMMDAAIEYPQQVIIGSRLINRDQAPKQRVFANNVSDFFITWAAGKRIIDTQSGFKIYPITLLTDNMYRYSRKQRFILETRLLIDAGKQDYQFHSVAIKSHYPQQHRHSYYRPLKDTLSISNTISREILAQGFNLKGLLRAFKRQTV